MSQTAPAASGTPAAAAHGAGSAGIVHASSPASPVAHNGMVHSASALDGLSPEAYMSRSSCPGASRSRDPSHASTDITPDEARRANQYLAEGADATPGPQTKYKGPAANVWRVVPRYQGDGAGDDEDEPLTNLQAEVLSYLTFADAEGSDSQASTTAKKAMASAAGELVEAIKHLQNSFRSSPNCTKSFSLLDSVARILPPLGGSKAPRSAPPSPVIATTTLRTDGSESKDSEPADDPSKRLSPHDEETMAKLLAGLRCKLVKDENNKARADEHRKACRQDLEHASEKTELMKKREAFLGFAGGEMPASMEGIADDVELTPQQKLDCLFQGFGPITDPVLLSALGEERYIGDHVGAVMAEAGLIGYFAVTTHRIAFIAYIPSPAQLAIDDARSSARGEDAAAAPDMSEQLVGHLLMQSGSAVRHRTVAGVPAPIMDRRVWLQLRSEGLFVFASSDTQALYEPLDVFRFQDIYSLEPIYSSARANFLAFSLKKSDGTKGDLVQFEFGTRVGTLNWRRAFRTALLRMHLSSSLIRLSLPVVRITQVLQQSTSHNLRLDLKFAPGQLYVAIDGQEDAPAVQSSHSQRRLIDTLLSEGRSNMSIAVLDYSPTLSWRMARFQNALQAVADKQLPADKLGSDSRVHLLIDGGEIVAHVVQLGHRTPNEKLSEASGQLHGDQVAADTFVQQMALSPESIRAIYHTQIWKSLNPTLGSLCVSSDYICFLREHMVLDDCRIRIPTTHLNGAKEGKKMLAFPTLAVEVKGIDDFIFSFTSSRERDHALEQINQVVKEIKQRLKGASNLKSRSPLVQPTLPTSTVNYIPRAINMGSRFQPRIPPRRFCIPVIGSRGDVQPLIELGITLRKHKHTVRIVSHPEYEDWVRSHGLDFAGAGGDPGALMALSVEHKLFSPAFFRDSVSKFRDWLDNLLREVYEGCYDADAILEAPQTMAGIHVAERLGVPYVRIFTMPWTKTAAYPQAFGVPPVDLGAHYNLMSYSVFDQVFWAASQGQINRWRKNMLGLKSTDLSDLDTSSVPFIYNFSPAVVPVPTDWDDNICVSGYWFLETSQKEWDPPNDLVAFLNEGRKKGKKLAYCGFGSIVVDNPDEMTRNLYGAIEKAGVYAVVARGWSSRMEKSGSKKHEEIPVPTCCYVVDSIPHDWLFPQIDIALHHGGAGTTGASLRASLVTAIKPFFGDQFFWAQRVQKLGAGIRVNSLSTSDLASALKKAAEDRIMREKAQQVGASIMTENGPANAVAFLYENLERARRHPRFRDDLHILHGDKLVFYPEPNVDQDASEVDASFEEGVDADIEPGSSPRESRDTAHSVSDGASEDVGTDGDDKSLHRRTKPTRLLKKLGSKLNPLKDKEDSDAKSVSSVKSSPKDNFLPSVPSLPNLPILDGLPKLSLTSAFRQMADTDGDDADKEEMKEQSKKDAWSVRLEDQSHALQLLPRQIELRLSHRLAEQAHKLHLQDAPPA